MTATALRMMDESIIVWDQDLEYGAKLAAGASSIFGSGVLLALQAMQAERTLPPPGSDEWDQFAGQAEAGDVAVAVVVLLRDRQPVLDPRLASGQAAAVASPPPAGSEAGFLKRLHWMVHGSEAVRNMLAEPARDQETGRPDRAAARVARACPERGWPIAGAGRSAVGVPR